MSPIHCQTEGRRLMSFFVKKGAQYAKNKVTKLFLYHDDGVLYGLLYDLLHTVSQIRQFFVSHNESCHP